MQHLNYCIKSKQTVILEKQMKYKIFILGSHVIQSMIST